MKKINVRNLRPEPWTSPKGRFASSSQTLSIALGRDPDATDLNLRHPFDVEICRVPPGKAACPYHSHSAQWEFYHVLSGSGRTRHAGGHTSIEAGDAFVFRPGEPHQLINDGPDELVVLIVADNPLGESCHYPDSGKWMVRSPERTLIRSAALDYFDGEE
jgi:uncharacterized cupin superfamily protein